MPDGVSRVLLPPQKAKISKTQVLAWVLVFYKKRYKFRFNVKFGMEREPAIKKIRK